MVNFKRAVKAVSLALALSISALCLTATPSIRVSGTDSTLDSYQKQLDNIDAQIAQNQAKLDKVNSEIKDNKSKYSALSSEISSINSQIDLLDSKVNVLNNNITALESSILQTQSDIDATSKQIEETQKNIDEAGALMQDTREELLGRIRENYMAGESSTIEILFECNDMSSYFQRKELLARVSEEDAALISNLTEKIERLNEMQVILENSKATLEQKQNDLNDEQKALLEKEESLQESIDVQQEKKAGVTAKQQELSQVISELDEDSEEYKEAIKKQEAEREKLNAQIDEYIRANASSVGDTPDAAIVNDGTMMWPVKGSTKITAGYPAYSDGSSHWGIDIVKTDGTTRGSPFYAAQGGKVIIAVNDGNWNYGFGNYCVIDHGDGKMTLYAHSDNIQVSVGQIVTKGQQIGIIGATGNVTGPHLHFEVRIKNSDGSVSRVNPLNYVKQS